MAKRRVGIDHPLYDRLRRFDLEVARRFPEALFPGLGALGLRFNRRLDEIRYSNTTPLNCQTFADTGGDGVHFSFLVRDGMVREDSPVILSVPCMLANIVVGEDLFEFLCLGASRGYFGLEQLAYKPEVTRDVFTDPDWRPTQRWHESVGFVPDEQDRQILALLMSEFGLQPWPNSTRFDVLQERYARCLELPAEA